MATKKEIVNSSNFEELLLKSANEALEFTKGNKKLRVDFAYLIKKPRQYSSSKIKKIRSNLGLSQVVFASIFGVTVSAIRHWEQGIRNMPSPACRLLDLIEKDPDAIFQLIAEDKAS